MVLKPFTDFFTICVGLSLTIPEVTPAPFAGLGKPALFPPAISIRLGRFTLEAVVSIAARKFSHGVGVKIWLGLGFRH